MSDTTNSVDADEQIFTYAKNLTIGGIPADKRLDLLQQKGLSKEDAVHLLDDIESDLLEEKKIKGKVSIIIGLILVLLGAVVTTISILYASYLGIYIVTLGAFAVGLGKITQGLAQYYSKKPVD